MSAGSCQQRQIVTTKTIICGVVGQQSEEEVQKLEETGCVLFFGRDPGPFVDGSRFLYRIEDVRFLFRFPSPPRFV